MARDDFPRTNEDWSAVQRWVSNAARSSSDRTAAEFAAAPEARSVREDPLAGIVRPAASILNEERRLAGIAALVLGVMLAFITYGLARVGRFTSPVDQALLAILLFAGVLGIYLFISIRWSTRLRSKMLKKLVSGGTGDRT